MATMTRMTTIARRPMPVATVALLLLAVLFALPAPAAAQDDDTPPAIDPEAVEAMENRAAAEAVQGGGEAEDKEDRYIPGEEFFVGFLLASMIGFWAIRRRQPRTSGDDDGDASDGGNAAAAAK